MVKLDKDTSEVFNLVHLLSKTSGGAPLNEADLAFVADMLRRPSFNKEQRENSGYGLLHIAAAGEHAGLVSFLVQNGVDVHGRSGAKGQGSSALYLAAQNKRLENVRVLLDLNVDVHLVGGTSRESLLCAAAMAGGVEIVELLLAKGANPNDLRSGHPLLHRLAPHASCIDRIGRAPLEFLVLVASSLIQP
jgi:ankyrin repeat protein